MFCIYVTIARQLFLLPELEGRNLENANELNIATSRKIADVELTGQVGFSAEGERITKVLTASAQPRIDKVSTTAGEVKFDGKICYNFLVQQESGEIKNICKEESFAGSYQGDNIDDGGEVYGKAVLTDLINDGTSGEEVKYTSKIKTSLFAICVEKGLSCAVAPEGVYVKEEETSYMSFAGKLDSTANIFFDLQKDSKIHNILSTTNFATIKNVIPSDGYFAVSGEVYSNIIYQTEDGKLKSMFKQNQFQEEIASQDITRESVVEAWVTAGCGVVEENNDRGVFEITIPLYIESLVFNKQSQKCVVDAFSPKCEVKLTTTSFEQTEFEPTRQFDENILTTFTVPEGVAPIDKILTTTPNNISIINQVANQREVVFEGIANINIVFESVDDDDNATTNSLDVEVPYSITYQSPDIVKDATINSQASIGDVNVKAKRGGELEILAEVSINFAQNTNSTNAVTTGIELGEEKPPKNWALEIYLAHEGQTLWDVAKELDVPLSTLVEQNGELSLPLADGQKIVAYNYER